MSGEKSLCSRWKEALDDLRQSLAIWEPRLEKAGAFKHAEARESWEAFLADTVALQERFEDLRARDALFAREVGLAIADAVKLRGYWLRVAQGFSRFGVDATVDVALEVMAQLQSRKRLGEAAQAYGSDLVSSLAERLSQALKQPEEELEAARRTRAEAERLLAERQRLTEELERSFQARHQALQSRLEALESEKARLLGGHVAASHEERLRAAEAKAQLEREHAAALARLQERVARLDEQLRQAQERESQAVAQRLEAYQRLDAVSAEVQRRALASAEEQAGADAVRAESRGEARRLADELKRAEAELKRVNAELEAERLKVQRLTEELETSYQSKPGS